ncbi:DUF2129 domain-containing protein [Streptococcus dentiloxodontae]
MLSNRQGIVVYLYYNRDLRKVAKFGDVFYHSHRMRYVYLYVAADKAQDIMAELKKMKAVKKVVPSYYTDLDMDFVGSLERHDISVPKDYHNFSR